MRIAVIVNRGAGFFTAGEVDAGALRQAFLDEGTEAEVHVVPGERIAEVARAAVAAGAEATASALLKVFPKLSSLSVRVKADGRVSEWRTHFIFVGNNEYEMRAFSFGARQRFDSGDLYLYIARTPPRLGLVGLALLGLVRDVTQTKHFARRCLPEFTVESRKQLLLVYLDGEVIHLRPPLRYRNRTRDLRVIVPPRRS